MKCNHTSKAKQCSCKISQQLPKMD